MSNSDPLSFDSLPLAAALRSNLAELGYHSMTEIQAAALPPMLKGEDVIGQAKTGSGKTAAFGLSLLHKLQVDRFRIQALVLCPTRELADQVARELRTLGRRIHNIKILTLCGGMPFGPQKGSLEHGAHIIVGTPGRIEEHMRKGNLDFSEVATLVLDEADRMLDMGFQQSVDNIVADLPAVRQTLLFSATFPTSIEALAARVQKTPVRVEVASTHSASSIEQHFYQVAADTRAEALCQVLGHYRPQSSVVFCNTRRETDEVANQLRAAGYTALALHGDMEQRDRDQTLVCFANNSVSVLVATDVAARGLDIEDLNMVINYHLSRDEEVHVHRIGRTGRAGQQGVAVSLVADSEAFKLRRLEDTLQQSFTLEKLPTGGAEPPAKPAMVTLQIDGGKKQKLRAGDIVGALTGADGIDGGAIGKIHVFDLKAYVAVTRASSRQALAKLGKGKLKGRNFRVRVVGV
ncbi:ATP-dependent RNA helicase DbpA [Pseudomaricurvus alcaniphilus]|uniref:ATP-dependent RNA helicase DbpA n=1 Tax=Pseudomaricurvus alcaniphilus TaxID=1166482 RepID=UPI0014094843|nr:ATP-dependent RNA helicase DbpA [Pseudomaricurvus alcaniphilus]NHN39052.1 ATP-dependent RNA helicase DbpA [Pseudomaricurvus alcaniphilus]